MGIVFLLREDAAEDWLNAKRRKHAGSEASGIDFLRLCASGKLIAGRDVAPKRGKCLGRTRVCRDVTSSHGHAPAAPQVLSQQNKSFGIFERKWAEQDAFYEREDGSCGADPQGQGENDGDREAGCFA